MNISAYGVGPGQIWLDDVRCTGTEKHIANCSHADWGVHNCGHYEDVAVSCHGNLSCLYFVCVRLCTTTFCGVVALLVG